MSSSKHPEIEEPIVMFTGGAVGADRRFTEIASRNGHKVKVISFPGHKHSLPRPTDPNVEIRIIPAMDLESKTGVWMTRVAGKLERTFSTVPYTRKLLQRNYFQVREVASLYAVGNLLPNGLASSVRVDGGTGWTCQMFYEMQSASMEEAPNELRMIPMYLYSQEEKAWFQCGRKPVMGTTMEGVKKLVVVAAEWVRMEAPPPRPTGKYAGIGTRQLSVDGMAAIASLYQ